MTALPTELHDLPLQEKLDLLELLWADIKNSPGGYEPPSWHGKVVERRVQDYRSGKSTPIPLEKLAREWQQQRRE
jgi:putative addiction module component (TIGR02574 family)